MTTAPATTDADLLVRGGRVRVVDDHDTVTDALAIRDGLVVAHGAAAERLAGAGTQVVELDGRTVVPGINDAHLHAAWLGARWPHLFFGDHEQSHEPQGRLVDDEASRRDALLRAWGLLASLGITSYTEPGIGPGEDDGETGCFGSAMLETYLSLHRAGAQTSRVTLLRLFGTIDGESDLGAFEAGIRIAPPVTDPRWLAVPGVKVFADGIPPLRSAWVRDPYLDGSSGGLLTRGPDGALAAFERMVRLAARDGLQIAVHATGDRAIEAFLDALRTVEQSPGAPHYVVHADLVAPDLLERMRRQGVGAAVQPLIAEHTVQWAGLQLGADRAAAAWPLGAMIDGGVLTTITSDAPIATPDWRRSFDAAVSLIGDDAATRRAILRRLTVDPARQDGAAGWKGSLAVGMAADLVVLDDDPLATARAVAGIGVARTIVAGRTVFDATTDDATAGGEARALSRRPS